MARPLSIASDGANPFGDGAATTSTIRLVQQDEPDYVHAPAPSHAQHAMHEVGLGLGGGVGAESTSTLVQGSTGSGSSSGAHDGPPDTPRSSRPFASPYSESSAGPPSSAHRSTPSDPAARSSMWKGKAKAWDLDLERGYDERPRVGPEGQMYDAADRRAEGEEPAGAYPPMSEEEAEEKRIQEVRQSTP